MRKEKTTVEEPTANRAADPVNAGANSSAEVAVSLLIMLILPLFEEVTADPGTFCPGLPKAFSCPGAPTDPNPPVEVGEQDELCDG